MAPITMASTTMASTTMAPITMASTTMAPITMASTTMPSLFQTEQSQPQPQPEPQPEQPQPEQPQPEQPPTTIQTILPSTTMASTTMASTTMASTTMASTTMASTTMASTPEVPTETSKIVVDSQNSVDSSLKIEPQEMVQLSDSIIKVPIDRLLEVSNDITTAIDTVVNSIAPESKHTIIPISADSLQVNISSTGEYMSNLPRESFLQDTADIKYVIFVFDTSNENTKKAQMAALNEFNFSAIGKQTTSSNLLMYIIIILIVAILAAVLFFVLRK